MSSPGIVSAVQVSPSHQLYRIATGYAEMRMRMTEGAGNYTVKRLNILRLLSLDERQYKKIYRI